MMTVDERNEIEELLPWHAAGTLGPREAQRVEAALAGDPQLARHYELVREELAQTINLNETLGAPPARAMQGLFAKIDAEPARQPRASFEPGARIAEFFASLSPRTMAWSALAAALVLMLQAGVIGGMMLHEKGAGGGFATASVPNSVESEGAYVLIRFRPQAEAADVAQLLETDKFSIVEGPMAGGLYRVRVAPKKLSETDLAAVVKRLQDDKVVGFVAMTE